ncbi:MAG: transketolase, partial [Desulfobacterales bacterium]|nr:transketolase [Desulfobacterales bacterium]
MQDKIRKLEKKSKWVRNQVLEMIASAGKGHIGGAFSSADILVALYYGGILRFDPSDKDWDQRDRFILSKGHSCAALYAVLADLGYFPASELQSYQKQGCILGGHPDRKIPGIEADTGSLGHGLGIGAGLALSAKMDKKDFMTVVLLGDGECCEGSVWEAAMFAARHKLNNLVGIVDKNGLCVTDRIEDCVVMDPLDAKWQAYGWNVIVVNGHCFKALLSAFNDFRSRKDSRPLMIIANTIK